MFGFIKKAFFFFTGLAFFSTLTSVNLLNAAQLKYVLVTNQKCKIRPEIVIFNSDDPVFYLFSINASKCSDSRNNINDP